MSSSSLIATGLDQATTLFDGLSADDLELPTPCTAWTVLELTDHLVNSTVQMAVMARGEQPDWGSLGLHHDDPAPALRRAAADLVSALEVEEPGVPVGMLAAEIAVHTWDLATALGIDTAELEPALAEAGFAFMSESLTAEARGEAFAPEQHAPEGSSAYDRIAAFAGRSV